MGGTAFAAHLDNIDFAGKTGTAQVVNHSAGALVVSKDVATRANSWFVGISPRRNPDIAVVVLTEHGGWGSASAPVAAQIVEAFVDKQRRLDNNLQEAKVPAKVEVGAVWSERPEQTVDSAKVTTASAKDAAPALHGGHFTVPLSPTATGSQVAAVQR
jgi:penicillin-binding protein 2